MERFQITDTVEEVLAKIGSRIMDLRLARNWTQDELAARAGVSKRSVERLESGVANPRLEVFVAVGVALGRTEGFEALLPAIERTPQQILENVGLPQRARRKSRNVFKWGDEK